MKQAVIVKVPYTCGELFQGSINGIPCLVSCPIDFYSTAIVRKEEISRSRRPLPLKSRMAYENAISQWNIAQGFSVILRSNMPSGRGYGTSTADIGAVLYGLYGMIQDEELDPNLATEMAIAIEPTDSTFFKNLSLIDHLQGSFFEEMGAVPSGLSLVILDPGGEVDSIAFNNRSWHDALFPLAEDHQMAFEMLREGICKEDLRLIGAAASLSANVFQKILYNPLIEICQPLLASNKVLGICRAHSGTIVGILYDKNKVLVEEILSMVESLPLGAISIYNTNVVAGGARLSICDEEMECESENINDPWQ